MKMVAVVVLLYLGAKLLKLLILKKILDREDDLPAIFTFTAVIVAAAISKKLGIPEVLAVIVLAVALSTTNPKAFERNSRPFKDTFLPIFFFFFGISVELSGGIMEGLVLSSLQY